MSEKNHIFTSDDYEPTALATDSGNPIPTLTGEPARIFLERAAKAEEEAKKVVKTADKTSKAAIKTAEATAKATQKAAETAAKAAQKAAEIARKLSAP